MLIFNEDFCKGCELCVHFCPKRILFLDAAQVNAKGYNPVACSDMTACIACAICAKICPDSVITVGARQ